MIEHFVRDGAYLGRAPRERDSVVGHQLVDEFLAIDAVIALSCGRLASGGVSAVAGAFVGRRTRGRGRRRRRRACNDRFRGGDKLGAGGCSFEGPAGGEIAGGGAAGEVVTAAGPVAVTRAGVGVGSGGTAVSIAAGAATPNAPPVRISVSPCMAYRLWFRRLLNVVLHRRIGAAPRMSRTLSLKRASPDDRRDNCASAQIAVSVHGPVGAPCATTI